MNRQRKYYHLLVALFIIFGSLFILFVIWGYNSLSNLQSTITEVRYRTEKSIEREKNLKTLKRNYESIESDIPQINDTLPNGKNTSELLADLNLLANQSNLKLTSVQSTTFGKKALKTPNPALLQTIKGKYSLEIPMEIKIEGSFSGLLSFIQKIEGYQRIISISSLEITRLVEEGAPLDNVEAKIKITTYLRK